MKNNYEIPDSATKFILFQRTAYSSLPDFHLLGALRKIIPFVNYNRMVELEAKLRVQKIKAMYLADMEEEYLCIRSALPDNCTRILDVGCGVAGIDIFLYGHYEHEKAEFHLLDKSEVTESVFYDYHKKGAFYNSLEVAKETLQLNGINAQNVYLHEATEDNEITADGGFDLVLSLISWGFHYPVETYLERVYELLNRGGVVILDVRKGTGGLELIAQKFGEFSVISERRKYLRLRAVR